ncbi:hypothetical protein NW754_007647 [Fusarium falciforme]|nr:hypothetical protein NW754_007647 [Fusarium falciforme]
MRPSRRNTSTVRPKMPALVGDGGGQQRKPNTWPLSTTAEREKRIFELIDDTGFNFKVFFVAASGFLACSYTLFVTNAIAPAIAFVNPSCTMNKQASSDIDMLTLVGSICGMLIMGHLADRYRRKKLYGLELLTLIVSTMGVTQASSGVMSVDYRSSMKIYSWLAWWRAVLGFGIVSNLCHHSSLMGIN